MWSYWVYEPILVRNAEKPETCLRVRLSDSQVTEAAAQQQC
jgi:hypothetical protein